MTVTPVPYDVGYYPEGFVPYDRQFVQDGVEHDSLTAARAAGVPLDDYTPYRPDEGPQSCRGVKKDGMPCGAYRIDGFEFCAGHRKAVAGMIGKSLVYLAGLSAPDPLAD